VNYCLLVLAAEEDVEDDEEYGNTGYCPNTSVEGGIVSKDVWWLQENIKLYYICTDFLSC
jgi:hypothetical protein